MKKLKTILVSAFLVLTLSSIAQQRIQGMWKVSGRDPSGTDYSGNLKIDTINQKWYRLIWEIKYPGKKGVTEFRGTGFYDPNSVELITAYGATNPRYGLFEYELNEKGGLFGTGNWTSQLGRGAELIGGKLNKSMVEGTYEVVGRRSQGDVEIGASETYKGTLRITKEGEMYHVIWELGESEPFEGFGYVINDKLVGVWGMGKAFGMKIYSLDGEQNSGVSDDWTSPFYSFKAGQETIEKQ
ncbi:MAG: hypothetical protein CMB80_10090 [Flammeovirgaceae bacterium]|nr:hypothetical protein [Flammeovirgaceae bacterium]MBE61119.1 hypothetical protein [Flammeovirgaceae bacterium]MBR08273.1 hypothetical protein [Rickettsiales bacterium]HCX21574.1 hypothetical protein [Cytophagales bacterium]